MAWKEKQIVTFCVNADGLTWDTADMMWLHVEIVIISNRHFKRIAGFQSFINDLLILTHSWLSLTPLWKHCPPLAWWLLFVAASVEGCCSGQLPGSATSSESERCFWAAAVSWGGRRRTLPLQSPTWPREKGSHAVGAAQSRAVWRCPGTPGTGMLAVERKKLWKMPWFHFKIAYFKIKNDIL